VPTALGLALRVATRLLSLFQVEGVEQACRPKPMHSDVRNMFELVGGEVA
jgi:hypothetical protein